jgi:hypothetical protein
VSGHLTRAKGDRRSTPKAFQGQGVSLLLAKFQKSAFTLLVGAHSCAPLRIVGNEKKFLWKNMKQPA